MTWPHPDSFDSTDDINREANGGVSHAREPKAVMKLSRAAKAVLAKGVPGREFWDSFMTRYPSLELHKSVSLDNYRVTWCKSVH